MIKISDKAVSIAGWLLLTSALVVAVGFAEKAQHEIECAELKVSIKNESDLQFVTKADILELFSSKTSSVKGKAIAMLDIRNMEKKVMSNPHVRQAQVFTNVDGVITIEVEQRVPVLRVINHGNEHFYVDTDGCFMPLGNDFNSRVPVVSGYVFDGLDQRNLDFAVRHNAVDSIKPVLTQVFEVASFLRKDKFWDAFIEQIYVNQKNEIELVPRVGNQIVLIGSSENLEEKLNNLMKFYKEGAGRTGWDTYSTINLKFKGQVVCTKSEIKPIITANP
ncbi:MAG: cell division protein FtsQ/DivIB [Bacteroidota bacterium]